MNNTAPKGNFGSLEELYQFLIEDHELCQDRFVESSNLKFDFDEFEYRANIDEQGHNKLEDLRWDIFLKTAFLTLGSSERKHLDQESRNINLSFNKTSWSQFCKKFEIQTTLVKKICSEGNPELAVAIVNHCINTIKTNKLLLRFRRNSSTRYQLRAIREPFYNRLDNIYIVEQLIKRQEEILDAFKVHYINLAFDKLTIEFKDETKAVELSKLNEEFLTGIKLQNSDNGLLPFKVTCMYLRLVCTNGMTATDEMEIKTKKMKSFLTTKYPDNIPPAFLPESLQSELQYSLIDVFNMAREHHKSPKMIGNMTRNINQLADTFLDVVDFGSREHETQIKRYINAVLIQSGMRLVKGISMQSIYESYLTERSHSKEDNAYTLYNAITRYASHTLRQPAQLDDTANINEDYTDLSESISHRARRIIDHGYDWDKTHKRANRPERVDLPKI